MRRFTATVLGVTMNSAWKQAALYASITAILTACGGDDGRRGKTGADGLSSLVDQTVINAGDAQCFSGGTRIDSGVDLDNNGTLDEAEITATSSVCNATTLDTLNNFNRIATLPVCEQDDPNCHSDTQTAAEIVAVSSDNMTLVYTDSPAERLGFVDITTPSAPQAIGTLALAGEPTSVAVKGAYALVGVNTSADFINVSGALAVVDIESQTLVTSLDLGGQPDSVAVSPDGKYAAVVIENERDEDLAEGVPPQLPAGMLIIVDMADADPKKWTTRNVSMVGLAELYPTDPEPEFVDINADNIAVVTLQENNHLVLVNLSDGSIVNHFSAGSADLDMIDVEEEEPAIINQTDIEIDVLREPDGVAWINNDYFATADEGDLDGGSRSFTIFNTEGEVVWTSGAMLDQLAARLGHYPDGRSGNKGSEPENVEVGIFGDNRYLFVNSERSSLVFVFDVADPRKPQFKQTLPTAVGPEGGLAIPSRNLMVVASEEDARDDKIRSSLNIYSYEFGEARYPSLLSTNRSNGVPIPWAAMSGLAADPLNADILYAVDDSFYAQNRIFKIDVSEQPARITGEIYLRDNNDVFAAIATSGTAADANTFDAVDLAAMINADKTVNLDPEGIAVASDGGFWIASEGAGTVTETDKRPIEKLNFVFKTDNQGVISDVITLPADVNNLQVRFGFEGVAEDDGKVYVILQRAWGAESNPRIGIYDIASKSWSFVFYPLDVVASQAGGWVGLSDISALGQGKFLIIERDNQGGPDAAIKRLYRIDLSAPVADSTISKTLVRDLMSDLRAAGGLIPEKIEGSAVTKDGDVYIINDNDGVDDNSGETQLLNLGRIL